MDFEQVLHSLNKRDIMLDNLSQIEDGKRWSTTVRKKGSTKMGYGYGKTIELAVKDALARMRDSMSDADWKKTEAVENQVKKKKRVKLR